jgi:hypothetical protein
VVVLATDAHDRVVLVRDGLRRFLWPLAGGGVLGAGWPLGGTVREREVEVAVARVAGVTGVMPNPNSPAPPAPGTPGTDVNAIITTGALRFFA